MEPASLVSIHIRQRAGRPWFNSRHEQWWDYFSSPPRPYRLWGPPSLLSIGYGGVLSPQIRRPVRQTDHSLPSSAGVKNAWSYTYTS